VQFHKILLSPTKEKVLALATTSGTWSKDKVLKDGQQVHFWSQFSQVQTANQEIIHSSNNVTEDGVQTNSEVLQLFAKSDV
jgi:hypothetical protein